ncbi:MAG: hypothetical protein ACI89X_002384 [Planctomycetota bacterium]|jgi:hypothetical protein
MDSKQSLFSQRVIAILIMAWGAGWLGRYSAAASDDWFMIGLAGGLGVAALAVALSVWQSSHRAPAAYVAWAAADVIGLITLDVLSDTEVWKVVLGGALAAALLTAFGTALVSVRRPQQLAA